MTGTDVVIGALIAVGVAAELICCVGLVSARTALARVHYASAGSSVGPIVLAVAVAVEERASATTLSALVVAALVLVLGAAAAHAIAVRADAQS